VKNDMSRAGEIKQNQGKLGEIMKVRYFSTKNENTQISPDGIHFFYWLYRSLKSTLLSFVLSQIQPALN
jgi:hypothetical protein